MWRSMFSSADNLRLLAECGCDLTYANHDGLSAASLAAEAGALDALRFLLEQVGVDDPGGQLRARAEKETAQAGNDSIALGHLDSRPSTP